MVLMSFNKTEQKCLIDLAFGSIQYGLSNGKPMPVNLGDYPSHLCEQLACFVTLEIKQQLRGCIGMLEAVRPLVVDVAENAFSAAFKDPRFPALTKDEYALLSLDISVLSVPESIVFSSEQDLIKQIQPKVDGLILQEKGRRGTFLPSVWQSLPERKQFLRHLKQKAGLPPDYWSDTIKVFRYKTEFISSELITRPDSNEEG